jgi:hypothetical protein
MNLPGYPPRQSSEKWRKCVPVISARIAEAGIDNALEVFPEIVAKTLTRETDRGKGILLMGTTGNGKTRRLRFMSKCLGIHMEDSWEMVDKIRRIDTVSYIREVTRTDFSLSAVHPRYYDLIIDDLGYEDEKSVSWGNARDIMERILLQRYQVFPAHKTHFATNLTPAQLKKRYGDRNFSRLNEMCHFIVMPGGDRRMSQNLEI